MDKLKIDKRLLSPNKINLPITVNENGILDEYIQSDDKNCLEVFTCAICTCLAWDPVFCFKCDKPFCRACITKYGKNKKCPFKCDSSTFREITRNEKNYLNKIKIKCTNVGCQKYIPYSNYTNHLEECQLRKYHCKNQNCREEGYLSNMIKHSKICPCRMVPCSKCKQIITFSEMKTHQQEFCPEMIVKCQLCGMTMKRGIYYKEHKSDNNDNIKCLQSQVENWSKVYNDDINYKNKEIMELKNKLKEMEKNKKTYENENATLKKDLGEIKSFFKNGYTKFFVPEKNFFRSLNFEQEDSKSSERDSINSKDYLGSQNSFYCRKINNINKYGGRTDRRNVRFAIINNSSCSKEKEKFKDSSYFQYIKKVQSMENFPKDCNAKSFNMNKTNPFK
jgi:hypothetical protein